jgi:hypothetical protein
VAALAVAKKCKHCGEFLTDDRPSPGTPSESAADLAGPEPSIDHVETRDEYLARMGILSVPERNKIESWAKAVDPEPPKPVSGNWACSTCSKGFATSRDLYVHERDDHTPPDTAPTARVVQYTGENMAVPIKNGVPTCARCGGTQFTARRKTSTKVMFGVASLAGKPKFVECEVCGARYRRVNA